MKIVSLRAQQAVVKRGSKEIRSLDASHEGVQSVLAEGARCPIANIVLQQGMKIVKLTHQDKLFLANCIGNWEVTPNGKPIDGRFDLLFASKAVS